MMDIKIKLNKIEYEKVLKAMHYIMCGERRDSIAIDVDFEDIEMAVDQEWKKQDSFQRKEYSLEKLMKQVELYQYPVEE